MTYRNDQSTAMPAAMVSIALRLHHATAPATSAAISLAFPGSMRSTPSGMKTTAGTTMAVSHDTAPADAAFDLRQEDLFTRIVRALRAIVVTEDRLEASGDVIRIAIEGIGLLQNVVA